MAKVNIIESEWIDTMITAGVNKVLTGLMIMEHYEPGSTSRMSYYDYSTYVGPDDPLEVMDMMSPTHREYMMKEWEIDPESESWYFPVAT